MDANKTCEIVLKYVKKSNLNWSLTESPFSVTINVKKSFIKDQHGVFRTSEIVNHEEHVKFLDSTISEQKQTIEEYQHEVHELSMQLQKAKKEISDVMLEKQHIVNAGEVIEGLLVNKNSEIVQLKEQKKELKLLVSKNDLKSEDIISVKDLNEPKIKIETVDVNLTSTSSSNRTENSATSSPPHRASSSTGSTGSRAPLSKTMSIIRKPNPPPPEKCTILHHSGSKYHEHIISSGGVPARFNTHEDCMRIDNDNYGCSDCVWFKWWGELHAYPDVNPWSFKKHLDPAEWPKLGLW